MPRAGRRGGGRGYNRRRSHKQQGPHRGKRSAKGRHRRKRKESRGKKEAQHQKVGAVTAEKCTRRPEKRQSETEARRGTLQPRRRTAQGGLQARPRPRPPLPAAFPLLSRPSLPSPPAACCSFACLQARITARLDLLARLLAPLCLLYLFSICSSPSVFPPCRPLSTCAPAGAGLVAISGW